MQFVIQSFFHLFMHAAVNALQMGLKLMSAELDYLAGAQNIPAL